MKADVKTLHDLTSTDVRYLVPRYQRPYVWTEEKHWEPLWSDIESAFERLENGETRDHFLGAIVLQEGDTPPGEPTRYQVIDGQQRLTTTQILIGAGANVAFEAGVDKVGRRLSRMVLNDEDAAEGDERFKLWPTAQDRHAFRLVMSPGGPPVDAEDDPNNTIQEAYDYFYRQISDFAVGDGSDPEAAAHRLDVLRAVFADVFKIVAIRLEGNDEAQVIFETLNARGTPLLALDLVKNAVFQAIGHNSGAVEQLHDEVWEPELGLPYWREEVRQGRLTRPRAELFLMHWMTMKLATRGIIKAPIRSDRLFQTFSSEILKDPNSDGPEALIRELVEDARAMRHLDDLEPASPEGRFLRTTDYLDTSVFFPLALYVFTNPEVSIETRREVLAIIESVQVRRTLIGLTGKGYNLITLNLLRAIGSSDEDAAKVTRDFFESSDSARSRWPSDSEIRERLEKRPIYGWVSRNKLAGMLAELERELRKDKRTEEIPLDDRALSIEHVMPQKWETHWPMEEATPEKEESRNELVQTIGNLTLVTGSLNSTLSNQSWSKKQDRFRNHSLLLLNRTIGSFEDWSETQIRIRASDLSGRFLKLWPGPGESDESKSAPTTWFVEERLGGELSPDELRKAYESATVRFRNLLTDLASHPNETRSFSEAEAGLNWAPGSLPAVLAGFTRYNPTTDGRRPFDTFEDQNSSWWIRMGEEVARQVQTIARDLPAEPTLSPKDQLKFDFFSGLLEVAREHSDLHAGVTPAASDWLMSGAGTSGVHWVYRIRPASTSVELALERPDASLNRRRFESVIAHREEVESNFGDALEWDAPESRKRCSIVKTIGLGGYESPRDEWLEIFEMTVSSMDRLESALSGDVKRFREEVRG